jgi:hypothetical protein
MSGESKKKKLPIKQRLFIAEVLNNPQKTQKECYKAVYGPVTDGTAHVNSTKIMARPEAKEHITEVLARLYPDLTSNAGSVLYEMITDNTRSDSIRLKALELLSKFQGWAAPIKSDKRIITADLSKYKLPGDNNGQ